MRKKANKQGVRVLHFIRRHGSITSMDAIGEFGITRLAARVFELKACGYTFHSVWETRVNRYGETIKYKRYSLEE